MFIKRNSSKRGDKLYSGILLVQGERVAQPRPPGRPRQGERRKTKVIHRTLANLSKLPEKLVGLKELAGQHLAAAGYNRDGKRYKKQIVVGLLTDGSGAPVSVQVYEGNRADPTTVADQVHKLAKDFAATEVVFVGDRGMLMEKHPRAKAEVSLQKAEAWLRTYKLHAYVTARLEERRVVLEVSDERQREVELLDGCYVVISDVPGEEASAQQVWERYGDL